MARPARSPSLSLETIDERRASLAAIGPALAKDGEVLLWSCETGRGARGAAFLAALAQASGASVAAASGRVGAAAPGGDWALDGAALRAPLTALGIAAYTGVMVAINWLGPKGSKGKPTSGTWNTTTNRDAGKVPGRSDDVNLGGNSAYTVTLDTTGNVKSLTIANNYATLAIGTQTLNIDIANTTSSSISVTNGHVTIAGGKIVGSAGFPDQAD
jgi:large repetitive protein